MYINKKLIFNNKDIFLNFSNNNDSTKYIYILLYIILNLDTESVLYEKNSIFKELFIQEYPLTYDIDDKSLNLYIRSKCLNNLLFLGKCFINDNLSIKSKLNQYNKIRLTENDLNVIINTIKYRKFNNYKLKDTIKGIEFKFNINSIFITLIKNLYKISSNRNNSIMNIDYNSNILKTSNIISDKIYLYNLNSIKCLLLLYEILYLRKNKAFSFRSNRINKSYINQILNKISINPELTYILGIYNPDFLFNIIINNKYL